MDVYKVSQKKKRKKEREIATIVKTFSFTTPPAKEDKRVCFRVVCSAFDVGIL